MDSTCWKVISGMGAAITALVVVIRILWVKVSEERAEGEKAKTEILELHKQRIKELEAFRQMVEEKRKNK
jgi:hypothetical protein